MIICKQTVKQIIFLCFLLPMNQMIPQCFQAILLGGKLIDPSALHMVEQEQRAQFPAIRSAMSNHFIDIMNVAFSNGKEVRCLFPAKEIVYKFMKPGSEPIILFAEVFGNHIDNVDTEAVHTFFDPEVHCVLHGLYNGWIVPVQIGLADSKRMQIILAPYRIIFPCAASEFRFPIIGNFIEPIIKIAVRIIFSLPGFLEPAVGSGGMIRHQIHDQLHTPGMERCDQRIHIFHGAKLIHDIPVI